MPRPGCHELTKPIYYRFRILRHDVAELTVFLGDPQGLAEPGLTPGVKRQEDAYLSLVTRSGPLIFLLASD
jgi:hypothetical protein